MRKKQPLKKQSVLLTVISVAFFSDDSPLEAARRASQAIQKYLDAIRPADRDLYKVHLKKATRKGAEYNVYYAG